MRRPPRTAPARPARPGPPSRSEVGGAPLRLPAWFDELSDRWWGLTPRTRTLGVLVLVLLALVATSVRVVASPYGPPQPVLVATVDLPTGAPVDGEVVRRERWPAELVPDGARTEAAGTLTAPLPAGAVLTAAHVTEAGVGGMVDAGDAAVPLPVELLPPLDPGAVVQVIASTPEGTGIVLADRAEVVVTDGSSAWLAVPEAAAADVAAAGLRGTVALAVLSTTAGRADVAVPAPP